MYSTSSSHDSDHDHDHPDHEHHDHEHHAPDPSLLETNVRAANGFTWGPILEVAKLFIGIFICMIPALKILQAGIDGSLSTVVLAVQTTTNDPVNAMYFWLTGVLSSFLDNAPTYVVFFNTAGGDPTSLIGSNVANTVSNQLWLPCLWALTLTSATHRTSWSKQLPRKTA